MCIRDRRPSPRAKGKVYNPVTVDQRPAGARKRSTLSQTATSEIGSQRNILPGYRDGLYSLGKGFVPTSEGIYEENASIYSLREQTEETKLFEINNSVRALLEGLESIDEKTTEEDDEVQTQQEAK